MKTIIISFIIFLGISQSFSQSLESTEAENMFTKKRFTAIWQYYRDMLKSDSLNTDLNYKMGMCYLNSRSQKEKAAECFKKATASIDNKENILATDYKLLADACYLVSDFKNAIINYEKYKKILLRNKKINYAATEEINREVEMCKMAAELKELKEMTAGLLNHKCESKNNYTGFSMLNYPVTFPYQEPIAAPFEYKKPGTPIKTCDDNLFEGCKTSNSFQVLKRTDTSVCKMETTVASSFDGQIILIYRNDSGTANLYVSRLNGNDWKAPEKLNKIINNKSWEPNEFVSVNGSTLYFASDREGGLGGKDLYKSVKLPNGEWGKAINLGPSVNSSFDEEAPFIHPDGVTLYFSSNRLRAKGSFDNFASVFTDSVGWTKPINVGYPLHNTVNSKMVEKKEVKKKSSEAYKENYKVTFVNQQKVPITVIKGNVINTDGKVPGYVEVVIANNENGETMGVYHPDVKTGKYICVVPPAKNNNITYEAEGYLFHSENVCVLPESNVFNVQETIELKPIKAGSKVTLRNIFFEEGKTSLSNASNIELNRIYKLLEQNPKMKIEISMTVNKKSESPQIKLAEDKTQSILNYFYEKGVAKANLEGNIYKKKIKEGSAESALTQNIELKILDVN